MPFDIGSPVVFFPIRHHSPACSYHLLKLIDEYRPDCILVEGPITADRLIPVLTDENTVLPIAFYYYYKDSRKLISEEAEDHKCYYPFLNTSPEYNALLAASRMGIDCGFIDLPYGEILINTAENKGIRRKKEIRSYNDDYYLSESAYFKSLCEKTGCRSFEELWERFFETEALFKPCEEFIEMMYTYCYIIRESTPPEELEHDGCLVRESFMTENIMKAMEDHKRVLVVTGGFHTPALYSAVKSGKEPKKLRLHNFDESIQNVYAMAYSFEAADALNGYASGMQNPGFYDKVWKRLQSGGSPDGVYNDTVLETLLECAKASAKSELLVTMSDISSAVTMYEGLARLRGKRSPGLYELYDCVRSCFIKGEVNASSELPLRLLSGIATGSEIGRLCESAETIPLMKDFETLTEKYRLKVNSVVEQKAELDIFSKPVHMEISRLFYQLSFLKTGFAKKEKGADIIHNTDRSRIREIWSYKRTANTDSALIDSSAYGATIEEVCKVLASRALANEQRSGEAAKLYVECFLMGISAAERFTERMDDIIISDGDFFSVGKAVYYFNMLCSLHKLYGLNKTMSGYFLKKCFQKILIMLPSMIGVSEDRSAECIKICKLLYNIASDNMFVSEYSELIRRFRFMAESDAPEPALLGCITGLIYGSDPSYKSRIEAIINGYLSGTELQRKSGASFLRGLFSTARDIVLIGDDFVRITDRLIKELPMESFMEILPELRLAFSYFTPAEIDSVAEKAAGIYNTKAADIKRKTEIYDDIYAVGIELEHLICGREGES